MDSNPGPSTQPGRAGKPKPKGPSAKTLHLWITFSFYSPTMALMFPALENTKRVVVRCMGCRENTPAPVRVCALPTDHRHCGERRRWSEVFLGRLSHLSSESLCVRQV